jgi:hypothetical protein
MGSPVIPNQAFSVALRRSLGRCVKGIKRSADFCCGFQTIVARNRFYFSPALASTIIDVLK